MPKQQQKYLPLEILKDYRGNETESSFYAIGRRRGFVPDGISRNDLLDHIVKEAYLTKAPAEEWKAADTVAMRVTYSLAKQAQESNTGVDGIAEAKDQLCIADLILTWGDTKQVCKIDNRFLRELVNTGDLSIPASSLLRLPFPCLYIDFNDAPETAPVKGAYVYIAGDELSPQLAILMAAEDHTVFSYYSQFQYENGIAVLPELAMPNTPFVAINISNRQPQLYHSQDPRAEVVRAVLQVLIFLSADNKDITENPVSKKVYRKPSVVRDKFSEVRTWDVGVRYGKAIHLAEQTATKEQENEESENKEERKVKPRKPVRPHVRGAHWQRYHVGKGRKEIRVNWIAPTFVCGDRTVKVELPAVIHTVKD